MPLKYNTAGKYRQMHFATQQKCVAIMTDYQSWRLDGLSERLSNWKARVRPTLKLSVTTKAQPTTSEKRWKKWMRRNCAAG